MLEDRAFERARACVCVFVHVPEETPNLITFGM